MLQSERTAILSALQDEDGIRWLENLDRSNFAQPRKVLAESIIRAFKIGNSKKVPTLKTLRTSVITEKEMGIIDGALCEAITEEIGFIEIIAEGHDKDSLIHERHFIDSSITAERTRNLFTTRMSSVQLLMEQGKVEEIAPALASIQTILASSINPEKADHVDLFNDFERQEGWIEERKNQLKGISTTGGRIIRSGIGMIDDEFVGFMPSELIVISGLSGGGKSTVLKGLTAGMLYANDNINVLHIANEENLWQVCFKYNAMFSGIDYLKFKRGELNDGELASWKNTIKELQSYNGSRLFIKELPLGHSAVDIQRTIDSFHNKGIEIHAIVFDQFTRMSPCAKTLTGVEAETKSAQELKETARNRNIPIIVATQAKTVVEEKNEKGTVASNYDVYGGKAIIHEASIHMVITRLGTVKGQNDLDQKKRDVVMQWDFTKGRDGAIAPFRVIQRVKTGQLSLPETIEEGLFDRIDKTIKNEMPVMSFKSQKGKSSILNEISTEEDN